MKAIRAGLPAGTAIEVWWQDEARVGQKNTLPRRWARRGTRPSASKDQRTAYAYIFGAICPEQGKGAGLVLPRCDSEAMNLQLAKISRSVAPRAHAVLMLDGAGWHGAHDVVVPDNITLLTLPLCAPELNPVENVWQFMRDNWLGDRIFASYDDIVDSCCDAWNRLHRPALEVHVPGPAFVGLPVMLNADWYKPVPALWPARAVTHPLSPTAPVGARGPTFPSPGDKCCGGGARAAATESFSAAYGLTKCARYAPSCWM